MNYDILVIGAGPGGYVCAIRASQLGQKVAIIDKEWLGGVCLNIGCIPSKTLLKNAEIVNIIRNRSKEFGFTFDNLDIDYSVAVRRSRKVSQRLTKGIEHLMKKNNIDVYMGKARIQSINEVAMTEANGKTTIITAKNIVVASGARPKTPEQFKIDNSKIVTYRDAILQNQHPKSVVIIGGGAIGVEFATIWNSYGSEVTIVEMMNNILPMEDIEISAELTRSLTKAGIRILKDSKVEEIDLEDQNVTIKISNKSGHSAIKAEQVLVAIGFTPNIEGLGLNAMGVKKDSQGFVQVNDSMSTNIENVYAIGDVTGKLLLAHVASAQGIVAAETIAGHPTVKLNYKMLPKATYCYPEVASFGYTESEAQEAGYNTRVSKFRFSANGKALSLGDHNGWIKIVSDDKHHDILGAHMIGPQVTELLPELSLAYNAELTAEDIARNIHAHPTLSEAIMETAQGLVDKIIHS
jgi:dihydrolipoamide dehydrogenase